MNSYSLSTQEITIRLLVAIALGGLVGWERERKDGAAGLRTHMLVCLASSLIMIVSSFGFGDIVGKPGIALDPSRIAAQVISGVGFLGAGTILFLKPQIIRGLTTAAGLWSVAGIGLAVGGGLYRAALIATGAVLIILAVIKPLERSMFKAMREKTVQLSINTKYFGLAELQRILAQNQLNASRIILTTGEDDQGEVRLSFPEKTPKESILVALDELRKTGGISNISVKI
jgi:putative Mg2+ transporter-C (MgtC) family protein